MSGARRSATAPAYALGGMLANGMLFLALGAVLALVVFIVLREFWTWYWQAVGAGGAARSRIDARLARDGRGAARRALPGPAGRPRHAPGGQARPAGAAQPPVGRSPPRRHQRLMVAWLP